MDRGAWGYSPQGPKESDTTEQLTHESRSIVSDSWQLRELYSPWNSPDQNTGVGSPSLLHEIFPTQGSNLHLLHCRWMLYHRATWEALYIQHIKVSGRPIWGQLISISCLMSLDFPETDPETKLPSAREIFGSNSGSTRKGVRD